MKTHYGVLWFNLIVSIIMAYSLNNFTELNLYLPVFFLYFSSNLAVFFEKYVSYRDMKYTWEQYFSCICIFLSGLMVLLYLFHTLNYLEIYFENVNNKYRMQIRSVPDSFYTFNSKDITNWVFAIALLVIPLTYVFLLIAAYLREEGYTLEILKNILKQKIRSVIVCFVISGSLGGLSAGYCLKKYEREYEGYGSPQWIKYLVCVFVLSFVIQLFFLVKRNKNIFEQSGTEEIEKEIVNE